MQGGNFPLLLEQAQEFPILSEPVPELKKIKDVQQQIKIYKNFLNQLLYKEQDAKNTGKAFLHYNYIRQFLLIAINNLQREIRKMRYFKKQAETDDNNGRITNDDVRRAKEVPLEHFLKINPAGFAHCPLGHTDKTPSLRVYKNKNRWFCYSCGSGYDVIDLFMKLNDCSFITAVKKLINKS